MDINCVDQCYYQRDGKCTLNELPSFSQFTAPASDMDCPYFIDDLEARRHGF